MKRIGILDPYGKQLNPLTGEKYSSSYDFFLKKSKWNEFPMYTNVRPESIIKDIINNQVIILEAGTGNGKSVLMPKYALHALDYKGKVVVTNPKQLPTRENADFAAKLLDVELGKEVGFQHQNSKLDDGRKSKSSSTKLLFSTDGSVVEVLRKNPRGEDYDIVIIDEAHERNLRIDLLLLQMKRALRINPDLKLIVMSATLPGNLFYNYFKEFKIKALNFPGKTNKPVKNHYLERPIPSNKVAEYSVKILFEDIVKKDKKGDVLIFTNSYPSAVKICNMINKKSKSYPREKIKCYVLTAQVTDPILKELAISEHKYKEEPGGPWDRKVVVGTNQVESSITVDGIVYVIDNGYSLESKFDFNRGEDQLLEERISKSSAMQRRGRAGRTKPGECFKLYTEKEEENMDRDPLLEIKKSEITGDIFDVFKEKNVDTVLDAKALFQQYIEPPPEISLNYSLKILHELKLLSDEDDDGKITEFGDKILMVLKLTGYNVRMACCIIKSIDYGCHFDICSIMAIVNNIKGINDVFVKFNPDFHNKKKYNNKKKFFSSDLGDIFSLRKMYETFYRKVKRFPIGRLKDLCKENFLNYDKLLSIRKDHLLFFRSSEKMEEYKDTKTKTYDLFTNILLSLLSGYSTNIAKKEESKFINWFPKIKTVAPLDPNSMIKKSNLNYILYIELKNIQGKRNYNLCTKLTKNQIDTINKVYNYNIKFNNKRGTKKRKIRRDLLLLKKKRISLRKKTRNV